MSEGHSEVAYIPYGGREEWQDVVPLPLQTDIPITPIIYTTECNKQFHDSDTMSYFRAVFKAMECSQRSLAISTHALILNPSHYTIWHYRRHVLQNLNAGAHDFQWALNELEWLRAMCAENPKTYQIWHHREWLTMSILSPLTASLVCDEIKDLNELLKDDGKNYHLWTYRMNLMKTFNDQDVFKNELKMTEDMLDVDVFNNSVWNYRHWIGNVLNCSRDEWYVSESAFTIQRIKLAPSNEAAWNYLLDICRNCAEKAAASVGELLKWCKDNLISDNSKIGFHTFIVESVEDNIPFITKNEATNSCAILSQIDLIRKEYWINKSHELSQK